MFGLFFSANAQIDSTHYNLGRVWVKKGFTQSMTIKGNDLERYQFSDLADAINVWLYGTYSNSSTLVYVIDNNIITDVNAYSIYDIESATLVQNALTQVSGASPGEQMVLIKLKTGGRGKQGFEGAEQTSIVNLRSPNSAPGTKTTTNFYNRYYISGYKNSKNADFGMSADYQYDVSPALMSDNIGFINPSHFARVKLNAYAKINLWKGSKFAARVNYTPQEGNVDSNYVVPLGSDAAHSNIHTTQHFFNTSIFLNSHILKGLTNTFSATYNHYNYFEEGSIYKHYSTPTGGFARYSWPTAYNKSSALLIRNNLFYQIKIDDFTFEPSVNFSYRNGSTSEGYYNGGTGQDMWTGPTKVYLITPTLNIYYKDVVNIQGGIIDNVSTGINFGNQKPKLPLFLSTTIDVGKISGYTGFHFQLFGSFSRQNPTLNESYFTIAGFPVADAGYRQQGNAYSSYTPALNTTFAQNDYYQAGAVMGLWKGITLNYNFGYIQDSSPILFRYGYYQLVGGDKLITNRVGLNYSYNWGVFSWITGLNITQSELQLIKGNIDYSSPNLYLPNNNADNFNLDIFKNGHRYSGGFTNRFAYQNLFAGLDVLYQIGERPYRYTDILQILYTTNLAPLYPNYHAPSNYNSFSLQNLYLGSKIKLHHLKYAEAFINGRNILQNKNSDITDNRRFLGIGFKVVL